MHLHAAVTEFFYSKDFTTDSARFYRRTLASFELWLEAQDVTEVADITTPLVRRYAASLRERVSERTGQRLTGVSQHGYMNALRTFLNFCVREEWLNERVPQRLEMPKKEKKVLQVLSTEQIRLLFRAIEASTTPERDRAVLSVLLDCGLRVAELCKLTLDDVHFHSNDAWLSIHGKGRKEREVPLGKKSRLALHRYIHNVREAPKAECHAIIGKRGPLTQAGVDKLLYILRDRAGTHHFSGVRVSAHTCRHTFAVGWLQAGGDIYRLSRLMGHGSVAITERYLQAMTSRQARMGNVSILDAL
jgi:integrase/recombinase XerD